ncbi:SLOG family protein [Acrocarpospora catenulata]|uniref:SLOG family protein n=1 Tax=Acrocarpospora catenulata TaxID=2836182 RepID=UPI001BDA79B5|nr:SLOG family protein [Acrocarpospora catenulata]
MPDDFVVLITGSRDWTDREALHFAILETWHDALTEGRKVKWRHGGCKTGADALADELLRQHGFVPEVVEADWATCNGPKCTPRHRRRRIGGGTFCPAAGLHRDARMVDMGANLCLAFIMPCIRKDCRRPQPHGSHGASFTADRAEKAGIPTRRFTPEAGSK